MGALTLEQTLSCWSLLLSMSNPHEPCGYLLYHFFFSLGFRPHCMASKSNVSVLCTIPECFQVRFAGAFEAYLCLVRKKKESLINS